MATMTEKARGEMMDREYDETPNPSEWGYCSCCDKPMSEYDWWHSQGHHCQECWNHLGSDGSGRCFCQIHEIDKAILAVDGDIPLRVNFALGRSYADSIVGAVLGLKGKGENIAQLAEEITHETLHIALLQNSGEQASDALDNPQVRTLLDAKNEAVGLDYEIIQIYEKPCAGETGPMAHSAGFGTPSTRRCLGDDRGGFNYLATLPRNQRAQKGGRAE